MLDTPLTPEIEQHLTAEFNRLKRSVDDLPYTTDFDSIIDTWPYAKKPTALQVWRWLSGLREEGDGKLAGFKAQPSALPNNVQHSLATMLNRQPSRDSLPYTPEFEQMLETLLRSGLDSAVTLHDMWRATVSMAKEKERRRAASPVDSSTDLTTQRRQPSPA
jgi:hypothetical protein